MSLYENIMFNTIKSLRIFNSKLSYYGHSGEKLLQKSMNSGDCSEET